MLETSAKVPMWGRLDIVVAYHRCRASYLGTDHAYLASSLSDLMWMFEMMTEQPGFPVIPIYPSVFDLGRDVSIYHGYKLR